MQIRSENDGLLKEQKGLKKLLGDEDEQWANIAAEIKDVKEKFSKKTAIGKRRTDFADAPEIDIDAHEAMIEKEPVTVVCSEKGWIRALKGHMEDASSLVYKDGDAASSCSRPRPPTRSCCSRRLENSSRSKAASCPAAVAMASRCA